MERPAWRTLAGLMRSMTLQSKQTVASSSRAPMLVKSAGSTRAFSQMTSVREEAKVSAEAKVYPFSSQISTPTILDSKILGAPQKVNSFDRGVVNYVEHQLRRQYDPNDRFTALFHRSSPKCIPVGSVLTVETWTNHEKTTSSGFSGVLIAIRRRGTSTSFILRNLVQKLGVEVRYNIYSPLLKDVKVLAYATGKKGDRNNLKRARRAKLFYLRKDDNKLAQIGRLIKQQQQQRARGY